MIDILVVLAYFCAIFGIGLYVGRKQESLESYALGNGQSKSDIGRAPLALGALTVGSTVREMSAAYATFANNGIYREARTFTKVYDSEGNLIIDNVQETEQILSQKSVDYVNICLYRATASGTGRECKRGISSRGKHGYQLDG